MDDSEIYDHVVGRELSTASESNVQRLVSKESHKTDLYVLNHCEAIMGSISPVDTSVIYLHKDDGEIESEPELVIDLSLESYTISEDDQEVVDLPYAKDPKLNHFNEAGSKIQVEKHDELRVSNCNLLHDIEGADDSLKGRTSQLNNRRTGHVRDERDSINFEVAELNSNQQASCELTIKCVSPLGICINTNRRYEELDEFFNRSLSGFHMPKMKYEKHEQQCPKCRYPLVQLSKYEKEKCVNMGKTGEAVELDKSTSFKRKLFPSTIGEVEERNLANLSSREKCPQQPDNSEPTVKRVRTLEDGLLHKSNFDKTILNGSSTTNHFLAVGYTFPSNIEKERVMKVRTSFQSTSQTIYPNKRLESPKNSEPAVRFVYPAEWLNGNNVADNSVPGLKTVSTRHPVQLTDDKERVIENMSPPRLSTSASFRRKLFEPPTGEVGERNLVNVSSREKRPQQPDNSEPMVKRRVRTLEDSLLHESDSDKTICNGPGATNNFPATVGYTFPSNIEKERQMSGRTSSQLTPRTIHPNRRLESSKNPEQTVSRLYPPEWFNGGKRVGDSVTLLKTVFTKYPVQLVDDKERVIGCMSPARLLMKSTGVNEKLDESIVRRVNGHHIANVSSRCRWPDQPSNLEPMVKSVNYFQTRCVSPTIVKERLATLVSTGTQLTQTVQNNRPLGSSKNSEPTVRFVHPPEWLNGGNKAFDSDSFLKTVSKRHPVQLTDNKERVSENRSSARIMSKSTTCVSDNPDESFDYLQSRCVSPSICKEGSAVSVSARTQLTQTIQNNRRLESLNNSEPTVRFACPPEWLNGDKAYCSDPVLKTLSTTRPVQLADDKKGVIENLSPTRLMSKSTCVNENPVESSGCFQTRCDSPFICTESSVSVSASTKLTQTIQNDRRLESSTKLSKQTVKFVCPPEWLNRDKVSDSIFPLKSVSSRRPHNCHQQLGDLEPMVERLSSSQGKRLFETNFSASISDEVSVTQGFNTVPCEDKSAASASNSIWLLGETDCSDRKLTSPVKLEQTVKFVCPSSWSNAYKDLKDFSPAIQTEASESHDSQTCASPKSEPRCMLPFAKDNEDEVMHVEHCDTIAYALELKAKQASMFNSLPLEPVALDLVNKIISNCCRQFLLNDSCTSERCTKVHDIQLDFNITGHDFKTSFNVLVRWYFNNSEQPNLKALLRLLSHLSRDFGDGLLITILCFSPALMKVKEDFRRPLGIKLIEKLVHQVDLSKNDAIRSIIIFNIAQDTKEALITDLIRSLGVYDVEVSSLYESVSCIWHINGNYSLPEDVLFPMLKECLREMPVQFGVAKEKIIAELLKFSRSVLIKHIVTIERILLKYYAWNSRASHKMRSIIYHGKIPEREDSMEKKSYQSSRVKSLGPIDHNMEYWDLQEQRIKSFESVMSKIRERADTEEPPAVELAAVPNFITQELLDNTDTGDNLKLLEKVVSTVDSTVCSKYVNRMQKALRLRKYHRLYSIFMSDAVRSSLDTYMNEFYYLLASLNMSELAQTIYTFLKLLSESEHKVAASVIMEKFTIKVNSLVLMFYKTGNFKNALKLLKTLIMSEVNPLGHCPEEIDEPTFTVVCSEIHFQCHCMHEAVRTLLEEDRMNYMTYVGCKMTLSNHFVLLERLVFRMFECFVKKRLPSLALTLFRGVYIAQKDLYYPINICRYYEPVLCNSLISCKASCAPHGGVELFILVESVSSNLDVILRPTTLRTLVVELVRVKAPDDTLRNILNVCFKRKVYPAFKIGTITLGTHLLVDEMYIYLLYYFKYFLTQDRQTFLQQPCTIELVESHKPLRKQCTFKDLTKVSNKIYDARERIKEALRLMVGEMYPILTIQFPSSCEVFIPTIGIKALAEYFS